MNREAIPRHELRAPLMVDRQVSNCASFQANPVCGQSLYLVRTSLVQDLADRHAQFVRHDDQVFLVLALMQRHLLVQAYDLQLLR